jgi:hypothetical protein|nr:MAG TPA: hypothetical protein [Caudoviricetes sp.]
MAKKLTPEERAARPAAGKAVKQDKAKEPAQETDAAAAQEAADQKTAKPVKTDEPGQEAADQRPADDAAEETAAQEPVDQQQPADDPDNPQEANDPSDAEPSEQGPVETTDKKKEDAPLSPATAYAGSPAELAARAAETEAARSAERPKSASDGLTKKGRQILEEYPAADVVYMTSNGFGFFREQDARNHAATLRNKTVTIVKRK